MSSQSFEDILDSGFRAFWSMVYQRQTALNAAQRAESQQLCEQGIALDELGDMGRQSGDKGLLGGLLAGSIDRDG